MPTSKRPIGTGPNRTCERTLEGGLSRLTVPKEVREVRNMRTYEIKQVVKTRYGKFAETGGKPEAC